MKRRLLLLLLLLLLPMIGLTTPTVACMNDYVTNMVAVKRSQSVLEQLQKHELKEPWPARRDRLRKALAGGGGYRVKNDLATTLAHIGEAAEAVTLLEQIEAEKPGLYATASNLGTAYELAGNDEKALVWIRKGIERNHWAHEGTEWLHVRILEAKLAMKKEPSWLESNSIVGLRKSSTSVTVSAVGNRGEPLTAEQVKAALIYQLHERLQFVNPPDAIVAALLLDLGELVGVESSGLGGARDVFKLAYIYAGELDAVKALRSNARLRLEAADDDQRTLQTRHPNPVLLWIGITGVLLAMLIICVKRIIRRVRQFPGRRAGQDPGAHRASAAVGQKS